MAKPARCWTGRPWPPPLCRGKAPPLCAPPAVAAWASRILGWLFVGAVATVEAWAERKEQRQQQREAAARLQQELEQELQKRQQVEDEKRRALARLAELGSGKRVDGGGSGRLANGGTLLPGAPPGPAAQHKPIESVLSWQAGLLERAAASARLAGDVPAPLEHASILPPSPQKPAGGAAAALLDGASSMSEVAARPQARLAAAALVPSMNGQPQLWQREPGWRPRGCHASWRHAATHAAPARPAG